jgi:hypothetical protein
MSDKKLPLSSLVVNPANDRHGELENEIAAIAPRSLHQSRDAKTSAHQHPAPTAASAVGVTFTG